MENKTSNLAELMYTSGYICTHALYNIPMLPIILLVLTCVLTLTLNPLYLVVNRQVKDVPTATKIFLASRTVSDFSMGIVVLLRIVIIMTCLHEHVYMWLTAVASFMNLFVLSECFLSLLLLTIDRYLAIAQCLHYPRLVTTHRAKMAVCCSWVVSAFLTTFYNVCGILRMYNIFDYFIIFLVILCLFGLFIIVGLNIHVLIIARRHVTQGIKWENQFEAENITPRVQRAHFKSFGTVFIMVVFILICWLPVCLVYLFALLGNNTEMLNINGSLKLAVQIVFLCSNWADGLVLYTRNRSFRQVLHKVVSTNFRALTQKCRSRTDK